MIPQQPGPADEDRSERRIGACLAACKGIPTEKLEQGILLRLIAACFGLRDPEVRHLLEDLAAAPAPPKPPRKPARTQASP